MTAARSGSANRYRVSATTPKSTVLAVLRHAIQDQSSTGALEKPQPHPAGFVGGLATKNHAYALKIPKSNAAAKIERRSPYPFAALHNAPTPTRTSIQGKKEATNVAVGAETTPWA
jgi:hypothetical protein